MNQLLNGIIHVHSDLSGDGLHSVADLAEFARESGFRFVGLTDHVEDLCLHDIESLQQECKAHSDESCLMIPGLEFRCSDDIHILGLGITKEIASTDPASVARQIQALGGVAILAHPARNEYQFPRELWRSLNGIEIWNAGYDGRYVPPFGNLCLLQEARSANPSLLGFGGEDLHAWEGRPGVVVELRENGEDGRLNTSTVLNGLRMGKFSIRGRYLSFDAMTGSYWLGGVPVKAFRKVYEFSRDCRNAVFGKS